MQASLGTATSDSGGNLAVYIDDLAGITQDKRTWFDGIGYKPALPLVPGADEDGDGLTNGDEDGAGTNPYLVDTDGDTYSDFEEVNGGSDPLDAASVPPLPGNSLEMTDNGTWTWFNDERAIFHQGSLFIGYVRSNGQYGVTRYNPVTNETFDMVISTGTSQQTDDHNNPSITILPDGKLMILYAKHRANANFYQRTSLVPLPSSIADWGPEIVRPLTTAYGTYDNTYNNTYLLSGESNRIYNFHRYINFNPTITVSDDLGATWKPSVPFISVGSGGTRPYPRYCSNGVDRIDLIYTDGHPRDYKNSVYHMYYEGDAFHKTDGSLIDTYANLPLDHEGGQKGSVIYQYSESAWGPGQGPDDWIPEARGWTWDVHYGADGHPVCVFQAQVGDTNNVLSDSQEWPNSRIYYYYARWTGTAWQKRFIAQAGRAIYSGEADYGGGMCIDPEDTNVIYISTNAANPFDLADVNNVPLAANARFEIFKGVTSDGGLTFTWTPVTSNSEQDNLRPIIPENSPFDETLVWFNGTYNSYTSFSTRVLAILRNRLRVKTSSISPAANTATLSWASSPGWRYRVTASADLNGFPHTAASGIDAQGGTTSATFPFPAALENSPKAFFRVETN
ncbi:MAG: BNR-4 repeat-containing protein [Akkermansiaceae bacterium]|nr:BNR-4 repeat-containing protein [Akkermansiaceae bacterium]